MYDIEETAKEIVDAALLIHKTVGPGMFESAYETMLAYEHFLRLTALTVNAVVRS